MTLHGVTFSSCGVSPAVFISCTRFADAGF